MQLNPSLEAQSQSCPAWAAAAAQCNDVRHDDAFPACVLLLGLSKNETQNLCLQPGQGPEHTDCCVPTAWAVCAVSCRTGKQAPHVKHYHMKMWLEDMSSYLFNAEWIILFYYIDIYLYNAIGNIENQTLLKKSGFGWFVPFCVCYMTSWHYLERKNPTKHLYHDYKRNGPRLLWLLCFHWMQNFLCPVSVLKSKKLLFGGLMWALLGGKDLQSELPPSVSCLMLQWNCQLEITVPTF